MTNFQFKFVLSAKQVLDLAYDLLNQTVKFADSLSRVQTFDVNREIHTNIIKFWHLEKEYTLTVYSAKSIVLSYYCPKTDYAGSQCFNSIESCFKALNHISNLEVSCTRVNSVRAAYEFEYIQKSWTPKNETDKLPLCTPVTDEADGYKFTR